MSTQTRSIALRLVVLLGLAALPLLGSCGGASTMQRPDTRPDPLADLDAQEARLRQAQQELEQAGPACETRCHAGTSICDAARRICSIASDLGDERSLARCETAQGTCAQATERLSACACEGEAPDAGRVKSSSASL